MTEWNYGDAYLRHPIMENQLAVSSDGSMLKPHNIFDPLPEFMKSADLMFVDPPWNLGNLNTFYTKAERDDKQDSFEKFYNRLFACICIIDPKICYIEVGKEYLCEFMQKMKSQFRQVTFYNNTYYHKKNNLCYIIRGSSKRKKLPLDNIDEENAIEWICQNEDYECIADLCMGLGLVALNAFKTGKKFIGTELNHKRLSATIKSLVEIGARYEIKEAQNA